MNKNLIVGIAILLYCSWNAADLLIAWQTASLERFSWLLFLIWLLPLFYMFKYPLRKEIPYAWLLLSGLLLTFIGSLGTLNMLKYMGLAATSASFLPWKTSNIFWLTSALVWMPAFGWWSSHYILEGLFAIRLILILLPTSWTLYKVNS